MKTLKEQVAAVLWMFTGASLFVEGVLDMITIVMGKKAPEEDRL